MSPTTLVLGLGNSLLTDEAVGIEVVRQLEEEAGLTDVVFLDGGTLSFTLAGPIADSARLIVVDAAVMGTAPGTIRVFEGEEMDRRLGAKHNSVHEVSLADLMDIARLTNSLPGHRALVGIEPSAVDWGDALTPSVSAAVPQAMTAVRRLITRWQGDLTANS